MTDLAQGICDIMYDYHYEDGFKFSHERVIKWVSQFEDKDQRFILEELLYILKQNTYISEKDARAILISQIKTLAVEHKFQNPVDFIKNVDFLRMQGAHKSQSILLRILDEEMTKNFHMSLSDCGVISKKHAVYIDDILATGGTLFEHCKVWLGIKDEAGKSNFEKLITNEKTFFVSLFCLHNWGADNVKWRLKYEFKNDFIMDKIRFQSHYIVENHPSWPNQKFNFAYPYAEGQSEMVLDYFNRLQAKRQGEFAFRRVGTPLKEVFFSSATNRMRFEKIILNKGIELLNQANTLDDNHRPLGVTNPTKKVLGTGTLFFTWRNISNTTPIVLWWGPHWYPLFPLNNRGN